ncbi:MAG: hypothetical protein NTX33_00495 [Propionibacteriales bacterium]|nr:hypothetical protein [Propionibacteriales bacterium]
MLIAIGSAKGSPGATSLALLLAAVWPRPAVLLEADPSGGDLAYRCKAAHGGAPYSDRGIVRLAAAVRSGGENDGDALLNQAQLLAVGVNLVQGVESSTQGRGLAGLWPSIANACKGASVDVIADLGRIDQTSATMPIAQAADATVMLATARLDSAMHLVHRVPEVAAAISGVRAVPRIVPVVIGPDSTSVSDRAAIDTWLERAGVPLTPTQSVPVDDAALARLERGERPEGRMSRTLLVRAGRALAGSLVGSLAPLEVLS